MRIIYSTITNSLNKFTPDFFMTKYFALFAWWSFVIAIISGIILSFNYSPVGNVFASVSKLSHAQPFGTLFRNLHLVSGQSFFIFTLAHTMEHFFKKSYRFMGSIMWTRLLLVFFMAFPLLFTGFILKGDKQGIFAGEIMVHLARQIPIIGSMAADLLLKPGTYFFLRPYLHHAVTLPFLIIWLLAEHKKNRLPDMPLFLPVLAFLIIIASVMPLPLDIPPRADVQHIYGPWFFHGIQLLLRYGHPFLFGIVLPFIPVLLMLGLCYVPKSCSTGIWTFTVLSWLFHIVILMLSWFYLPDQTFAVRF